MNNQKEYGYGILRIMIIILLLFISFFMFKKLKETEEQEQLTACENVCYPSKVKEDAPGIRCICLHSFGKNKYIY